MNHLIDIYQIVVHIANWGPTFPTPVHEAMLPLLIAGLAAAGGLAGGLGNYFGGSKERRRLNDAAAQLNKQRGASVNATQSVIKSLLSQANNLNTNATANDIYGQSIKSLQDRVQAGQAGTDAQLAKSLMASGGDVTGSMNAILQNLIGQSNNSITDIMNNYNDRVDRRNLAMQQLKSHYLDSALTGQQNLAQLLTGSQQNSQRLAIDKKQADKQFILSALGAGLQAGSMAIPGGGGANG